MTDRLPKEPRVSLVGEACEVRLLVVSNEEASTQGWKWIRSAWKQPRAKLIGLCPDCQAEEERRDAALLADE